jgi:hypothetical protein
VATALFCLSGHRINKRSWFADNQQEASVWLKSSWFNGDNIQSSHPTKCELDDPQSPISTFVLQWFDDSIVIA